MAVRAIDWKYAIGAELTDTGFDHTLLTKFRTRLVDHGLERAVFERLVAHCRDAGLIGPDGKQPTDATSGKPQPGGFRLGPTPGLAKLEGVQSMLVAVDLMENARRLFDARDQGASDQQLRDIVAEGLQEVYSKDGGRRAGNLEVAINDAPLLPDALLRAASRRRGRVPPVSLRPRNHPGVGGSRRE